MNNQYQKKREKREKRERREEEREEASTCCEEKRGEALSEKRREEKDIQCYETG